MSQLYVDNVRNRTGGAVSFSQGIVAVGGTISGNLSIGGTLTYEDVTNVDSVGLITARSGIIAVGVVTATSFSGDGSNLSGIDSTLDTWLYG